MKFCEFKKYILTFQADIFSLVILFSLSVYRDKEYKAAERSYVSPFNRLNVVVCDVAPIQKYTNSELLKCIMSLK